MTLARLNDSCRGVDVTDVDVVTGANENRRRGVIERFPRLRIPNTLN